MVEALYSNRRSLIVGGIAAICVALACFVSSGDPVYTIFASLVGFATLSRVATARRLRAEGWFDGEAADEMSETDKARRLAIIQGTFFASVLGAMTFYAIIQAPHGFAATACLAITLGNGIGVVGRSFASRLLVWLQIGAICIPISIGFALAGDPASLILAVLPLILIFATVEIASGQRATLDRAIDARRRSEELAHRLSITLETTPNGIMMFDANDRLRFANARACKLLAIVACDMPSHGGAGISRAEVEDRLETELETVRDTGLTEGAGHRAFKSRRDGSRIYRFQERSNDEGETVVRIDDVSELDRAERRAVRMARFDVLTGIAARAWFFERAEAMLVRAEARDAATAFVAVIDLDRLKTINDTHGHAMGDAALRELAHRIERVVGKQGLCARLGGDEFAVLALFEGDAARRVDALTNLLDDTLSYTLEVGPNVLSVQASCGVCVQSVGHHTMDELIERADFAQYQSKRNEERGLVRFDPAMEEELDRKARLRADLPRAVAEGHFATHYRPVFCARENRITGFDAMPRWTHPRYGSIEPAEFLPLARAVGAQRDLTRSVLRSAAGLGRSLPAHVGISVQVWVREVVSGATREDVTNVLASSGLEPSRLTLCVCEGALGEFEMLQRQAIADLRDCGPRLAVEGAASGALSLAHLKRLRLDELKLHPALTDGIDVTPASATVLSAVLSVVAALGLDAVVGGVTSEAQQTKIAEERTGQGTSIRMQGPLFGPALPARDAEELVRRSTANRPSEASLTDAGSNALTRLSAA